MSTIRHLSTLRGAAVIAALLIGTAAAAVPARAQERIYFPAVDNVTSVLVQKINAENVRIDMSAWYLSEGLIINALLQKHAEGVPIRLIGDRGAIFEIDQHTRNSFYRLANAGVPIRLRYHPTWYPEIAHWKATIFVGQNLVTFGSANYTPFELAPTSSTNYKDETVLFTDDSELVNAFKTQFDRMWNDTTREPRSLVSNPPYFMDWNDACARESACGDYRSLYPNPAPMTINRARLEADHPMPADMGWGQGPLFNNRIVNEINKEVNFVDFVIYRLTVPNVYEALLAKHNAGVPVRIIIEPSQYRNRDWPEFWLTHAYIDKLWAAGVPIKKRIHNGLTHMKMIVTSNVATNGSSNLAPTWQRDHNYFVPAQRKPEIYGPMKSRFNIMWNDSSGFANFVPESPDAPVLATPASGASGVSTTPTLVWERAAFAALYDVYLGTSEFNLSKVGEVAAQLVNNPPTTYSWTPSAPLQPGTTYYWKVVSRTFASRTASREPRSFTTGGSGGSTPPSGTTPFTGTPAAIPGRVQAENFDSGAPGAAYSDTSAGNNGGAYRSTDVDIETTADSGGGHNVGWMAPGEWLLYTVNVASAGSYRVDLRVAASGAGGRLHVEFDGADKTGPMTIPNTGGWQSWVTISAPVTLAAGTQRMRLVIDAAGSGGVVGNLNHVDVVSSGSSPPSGSTPFTGTPIALPGRAQAENFDNGGADVAYRDTSASNSGGQYRATDVDIEATSDGGGGYNVGWMAPGEWLVYTVNVASAGTYRLDLRVAANGAGGRLHVEFNGADKTGAMTIPNTGGWQTWTTISAPVTIAAGTQRMRVVVDAAGSGGIVGNLNHIDVVASSSTPQPASADEIVIYANDVATLAGNWTKASEATAAGGVTLRSADFGAGALSAPLASPAHYFQTTFVADAGVRYRIWLRMRAADDSKWNDSVFVQFSGAVNSSGSPIYRTGTTSALLVNLWTCGDCQSVRWGWQNGAYWQSDSGEVRFASSGPQTIRVQIREDGVEIDQIVISPADYLVNAPGPTSNDTTIVPK